MKQPWNCDTFSKNIETFSNLSVAIVSQKYQEFSMQVEIMNNCIIPSTHAIKKLLLFLNNTLLLYIPLLALTDGRNYRRRNKCTHCTWAGGTESHFVVKRKFIRDLNNTLLVKISLVHMI